MKGDERVVYSIKLRDKLPHTKKLDKREAGSPLANEEVRI